MSLCFKISCVKKSLGIFKDCWLPYNTLYFIIVLVEGSECTKKAGLAFAQLFTFKSVIKLASRAIRFSHERAIARHTLRAQSFDAESDRLLLHEIEQVARSLDFNSETGKRSGRRSAVDQCSIPASGIFTFKIGYIQTHEEKIHATETVETRFKQPQESFQEDWIITILSHIFRIEYLIKR